jgi:hypothetical protein
VHDYSETFGGTLLGNGGLLLLGCLCSSRGGGSLCSRGGSSLCSRGGSSLGSRSGGGLGRGGLSLTRS